METRFLFHTSCTTVILIGRRTYDVQFEGIILFVNFFFVVFIFFSILCGLKMVYSSVEIFAILFYELIKWHKATEVYLEKRL